MPELPEVEVIRRGLNSILPGRVIKAVDFNWAKTFPNSQADVSKFLINAKVKNIARRAKLIVINLDSDYSLLIHLKMTGQLVFRSSELQFGAGHPTASLTGHLPDKSTRVTINFKDGSQLFFNDQRKFGWMLLLPTKALRLHSLYGRLGPEPLAPDFTAKVLKERLARRANSSIKAALLDQSVIAGVGNIYADESLWGAKIHPATIVKNLSPQRITKLQAELINILKLAIKKGGSTDRNYVNAEGKSGSYLSFARVFRREGQPCPRCGRTIEKIRVAGRGTHYCPHCQRLKIK